MMELEVPPLDLWVESLKKKINHFVLRLHVTYKLR